MFGKKKETPTEHYNFCTVTFIEAEFQRVTIGPDDTIVLMHPKHISRQALHELEISTRRQFPGRKILLLEEGIKIGVLGKELKDGDTPPERTR